MTARAGTGVPEPLFKDVLQVGVVVRDLEASMKTYVDEYGIGPWSIFEIDSTTAQDLTQDEAPAPYAMRVALAMVGRVQMELIQPLDEHGLYADFLAAHGEGLHHVAFDVASYADAIEALRGKGHRVLLAGRHQGATWAYLSTEAELGFPAEIFHIPAGLEQKPHAVYPSPADR